MQLKDATVLIVEDERELLEGFTRWLAREGCRVLGAGNGAQGLELATANNVHLILSDVRMPVMNGVEMVRRLRSEKDYLPKIIFVSGFSDLTDRDGFDLGIESMLSKPIRRPDLVSVVQRCLMDAYERWSTSSAVATQKTLAASFESLATARSRGLVEFGRGGFCIRSTIAAPIGEVIALRLEFAADHHALIGQGVVRWIEQREQQIGVEITYVEAEHRAWIAGVVAATASKAFIPASGPGGEA